MATGEVRQEYFDSKSPIIDWADGELAKSVTISHSITFYRLQKTSKYLIRGTIKNRKATCIFLALIYGPAPNIRVEKGPGNTVEVTADEIDLEGGKNMESELFIKKNTDGPAILAVVNIELLNDQGPWPTEIDLTIVEDGLNNGCPAGCEHGECELDVCACKNGYFGRSCTKQYRGMGDEEAYKHKMKLKPYEQFYFMEDVKEGEKEIRFEVESKDRPLMLFLVNESEDNLPINYFNRQVSKARYKDIDYYLLGYLKQDGEQRRSFIAQKRYVYMTYINYESKEVSVDLLVERLKSSTVNIVSYILYLIITGTMIILFIMIIISSCFKKRQVAQVIPIENYPQEGDDEPFEYEVDSEEEERPITLDEKDYNRWMPIINIADFKKEHIKMFDECCTICLDTLENSTPVRQVITCKHSFHSNCLLDWLKVNESCPNCKDELNRRELLEKERKKQIISIIPGGEKNPKQDRNRRRRRRNRQNRRNVGGRSQMMRTSASFQNPNAVRVAPPRTNPQFMDESMDQGANMDDSMANLNPIEESFEEPTDRRSASRVPARRHNPIPPRNSNPQQLDHTPHSYAVPPQVPSGPGDVEMGYGLPQAENPQHDPTNEANSNNFAGLTPEEIEYNMEYERIRMWEMQGGDQIPVDMV